MKLAVAITAALTSWLHNCRKNKIYNIYLSTFPLILLEMLGYFLHSTLILPKRE